MRKIFSIIGFITLISLSLFINEKTTLVLKETDEIMSDIKKNYINYQNEPVDAKIIDNKIIPGLYGRNIDIDKSYNAMKKIGKYSEQYYEYNEIKPQITIENQYDKYIISANPQKNTISLVFLVYDDDNITNIEKILEKTETKATFFINQKWLENNNEKMLDLIKKGHTIGNLSNNVNYDKTEYIWILNILKKIGKQKNNYCYAPIENEKNLKACALQKNYTIIPDIIVNLNPLIEIKTKIKSGSIIAQRINNATNQELELVINYIKSKGYNLNNLEKHLSEKINN